MVEQCWGSLHSSVVLREAVAAPAGQMAVIVQLMIDADASGVAFTRNPVTDEAQVMIESTWGLGAALVDGRVTPDHFTVALTGDIVAERIARKRLRVVRTQDTDAKRYDDVDASQQLSASLSAEQVASVAQLALACESLFGSPQDVEFAIQAGEVLILQSRPISTTVVPQPPTEGRWVAFKPILENFDRPVTPLTADLCSQVVPPFMQFIQGRLYADYDVVRSLLPVSADDETLIRVILLSSPEDSAKLRWHWGRIALGLLLLPIAYIATGAFIARSRNLPLAAIDDFELRADAIARDTRIDARQALRKLTFGRGLTAPLATQVMALNVTSSRYFLLLWVLRKLVDRYAPGLDDHVIASLCTGSAHMWSTRLARSVTELADLARADPAAMGWLSAPLSPSSVPPATVPERGDGEFARKLADFIDEFGHRATMEVELSSPRWRDDPTPILQMIQNRAEASETDSPDPHALLMSSRDKLNQAIKPRFARRLANWLLLRIRYYVSVRENTRHQHARIFATVRAKILLIEHELLADRTLKVPGDVFFLTWQELMHLKDGKATWSDYEQTVRERRLAHNRGAITRAPRVINLPMLEPGTNADLRGQCASPGIALGRVRVITDPAIDARFEPGDVLVAPYADPAWTPLFTVASAIVVEIGSYLSHAGTIARELQIPCVVDVTHASTRLRDGDLVRVDATNGRIDLVQE